MKEQWRDVIGYVGYYQVSNFGRVRSLDRVVHRGTGIMKLKGKVLSSSPSGSVGHLTVHLSEGGIQRTIQVYRLVAKAWIGPYPAGMEVCHGLKGTKDNSVGNLCYGTRSENNFDKRRDGTHGGRAVRRSDGVEYINMCVAAEETGGCDANGIWSVCNSLKYTAGSYWWEYIDKPKKKKKPKKPKKSKKST